MYVYVLHVCDVINTDTYRYIHVHAYTYIYMQSLGQIHLPYMRVDALQIHTDTYR